ncbi:MAG: basic amino acid ABC transporter substrate-binding protein [Coriobacteriia bacterium]|nr:basic amino acid ABC transporter substrate-binding protein [Coriobacteriia bacterium]
MRKTLLIVLACVLALSVAVLVGCGSNDANETTTQVVSDSTVIRAATDPTFAPMEFLDENGDFAGFDIDLMEAIVKEMGDEVVFVNKGWDALIFAMSSGSDEADCAISSITIRPDREEVMLFSDPYFVSVQALAVPEGSDITSVEDLQPGMKVAVQNGTTGHFWVEDELEDKGIVIMPYPGGNDCFTAMAAGEVDAVIIDGPVADKYAAQPELKAVNLGEIDVAEAEKFGIAFPKGNEELRDRVNVALAAVIADGTYDTIYAKWFDGATPIMP